MGDDLDKQDFKPGQRWISRTELQMGLGTIAEVAHRTVDIIFGPEQVKRTYAKTSSPLSRVIFSIGDTVRNQAGLEIEISHIEHKNDLIIYVGTDNQAQQHSILETELDHFIQLSNPLDRLMSGLFDKSKWFELRYDTRQYKAKLSQHPLYGLTGTRTSLIPHQLYIANEVANRYAPRVLLADEVGLGKTIEAGLILHRQLLTDHAQRVIIIVPDSLIHQWFIEMLRRFNLYFSIFDEQRCQATEEHTQQNPFETEQLIICSIDFIASQPNRLTQILDCEWDLAVVDEAHHLMWSPEKASTEYLAVKEIVKKTQGVLLLTATPEQLGKEGHFARLHLLDPDRFPSLDSYIEEEQNYAPIANNIEKLITHDTLTNDEMSQLLTMSHLSTQEQLQETLDNEQDRTIFIYDLLDRYGTGRVLFRNTRHTISGFPARQVHEYLLDTPQYYLTQLSLFKDSDIEPQLLLCPELLYESAKEDDAPHWADIDPRIQWLADKLKQLKPEKALVITASAQTVLDIAQALKTKHGIHAAVFHEFLNIVERDRAAAYFSDKEDGSQVLICSEIGSEGRNFQFASQLILFDLPLNPDLLEQRIGRLDRIGQRHDIDIHVPCLQNTAQAIMYHWYHNGLSAFTQTCPAGNQVFEQIKPELATHLINATTETAPKLDELIQQTQTCYQTLLDKLQNGRDRLIEYNSYRESVANQLIEQAYDTTLDAELPRYLDRIFDNLGIDSDIHGGNSFLITTNEHTTTTLPGLNEEGMVITYHRETALTNEDMHYITWEHPLTLTAMDQIVSSETGNTAMVMIKHKGIQKGTLLIECLYNISPKAGTGATSKYLPHSTVRIVCDQNLKSRHEQLAVNLESYAPKNVDNETAKAVVNSQKEILKTIIQHCTALSEQQANALRDTAIQTASKEIQHETQRLRSLKETNANIRNEEIEHLEAMQIAVQEELSTTIAQLDAIRVMIVV